MEDLSTGRDRVQIINRRPQSTEFTKIIETRSMFMNLWRLH